LFAVVLTGALGMSDVKTDPDASEGLERDARELLAETDTSIRELRDWRLQQQQRQQKVLQSVVEKCSTASDEPMFGTFVTEPGVTAADASVRLNAVRIHAASSISASVPRVEHSLSAEQLRQQAIELHAKQLAAARLDELGLTAEGDDSFSGPSSIQLSK
jgi:hypothetical protein